MKPTETVKLFYELFATGKIAEMLEQCVAQDAILDNPLPPSIPFGGQYKGHQGFAAYAQDIHSGIQIEKFDIDEIFAAGDRVAVLGRETSRSRKTSKTYTMSWVHILTVRGGRIQHLREYNDTSEMASAFE